MLDFRLRILGRQVLRGRRKNLGFISRIDFFLVKTACVDPWNSEMNVQTNFLPNPGSIACTFLLGCWLQLKNGMELGWKLILEDAAAPASVTYRASRFC